MASIVVSCSKDRESEPSPYPVSTLVESNTEKPMFSLKARTTSEQLLEGLSIIERLAPEEFFQAMESLHAVQPSVQRSTVDLLENALLLRWMELNKEEALAYVHFEVDWARETHLTRHLKLLLLYQESPSALVEFILDQPESLQEELVTTTLGFLQESAEGYTALLDIITPERPHRTSEDEPLVKIDYARLTQLAQHKPEEAVQEIRRLLEAGAEPHTLGHFLTQASKNAPEAAGRLAIEIASKNLDHAYMIGEILMNWAAADPDSALEAIRDIPSYRTQKRLFKKGYEGWATTDPEAAVRHAYAYLPTSSAAFELMPPLLAKWMEQDPQRASQYVELLPPNAFRMYSSVYEPWMKQDPEAALTHLTSLAEQRLSFKSRTTTTFDILVPLWVEQDDAAALAWIQNFPKGRIKDHLLEAYLKTLPADRLDEGYDMINAMDSAFFRTEGALALIKKEDPQNLRQTLEKIQSMEHLPDKETVYTRVFGEWARREPVQAARQFPDHLGMENQKTIIRTIAPRYHNENAEEAMAWLETLPTTLRSTGYYVITQNINNRVGAYEAAQFLDQVPLNQSLFNGRLSGMVAHIARTWSKTDPDAAISWIETLPQEGGKAKAVNATLTDLLTTDPQRAASWVADNKNDPKTYNRMAAATSEFYLQNTDPTSAVAWALEVQDRDQRSKLVSKATRKLSDSERVQLLNSLLATQPLTEESTQWLKQHL